MSASSRGWGPGWPNCRRDEIITASIGDGRLRLPVHRGIAPLVVGLVTDLEAARGRPFRGDWSWGFACRPISGTNTPSNHSWGLAIDLDAPENPYTTNHRAPHTMPSNASELAAKWGFRWGGDYTRKKDFMHFEFMGTPADAARLAQLVSVAGLPVPEPVDLTIPGWAASAYERFGVLLRNSRPNDELPEARAVTILKRIIDSGVPAKVAAPAPVPSSAPGWAHAAYQAIGGVITSPEPLASLTEARTITILHRTIRADAGSADPPPDAPRWSHEAYRAFGARINTPRPNAAITEARFLVIIDRITPRPP